MSFGVVVSREHSSLREERRGEGGSGEVRVIGSILFSRSGRAIPETSEMSVRDGCFTNAHYRDISIIMPIPTESVCFASKGFLLPSSLLKSENKDFARQWDPGNKGQLPPN